MANKPNRNIVITAGKRYIDIDAYASMIAYRELLKILGNNAFAISTAPINQSVPPLIQDLKYHLDTNSPNNAEYIVVDVSNPDFFDDIVQNNTIIEILDHHTGFEQYWQGKVIEHQIEFIGSVCTMVFEKIVKNGKQEILDQDLCKLLIAGILDNTLNLRSSITTQRDIDAFGQLKSIGGISGEWYKDYFNACDTTIMQDYKGAILNDLKIEDVAPILPQAIAQMILLDTDKIGYQMIADTLSDYSEWVMNVIVLNDGKSYLYFNGNGVKERLQGLFNQPATNDHLLVLDQFLLRKQIMKKAREYSNR